MLALPRQLNAGDKATISMVADIEITLVEVRGDQVRIGAQAPRGVVVDRKEIWLEKQQSGCGAACPQQNPKYEEVYLHAPLLIYKLWRSTQAFLSHHPLSNYVFRGYNSSMNFVWNTLKAADGGRLGETSCPRTRTTARSVRN